MINPKTYKNSTELANISGVSLYMHDFADACLRGKLNLFLHGDTGSGKTQLVRDIMQYFGERSLFILGRNDMDTRELFQQVNPQFLKALKEGTAVKFKELTDKINFNLIAVDELPNCVPVVRAQLFNLFDGFIEVDGRAYPIGSGYSVGMATGNIGQRFTESSNDIGRALKDRMHVIIDTDYFRPQPRDTLEMLVGSRDPRVRFDEKPEDKIAEIIQSHQKVQEVEVPFEKYLTAAYLIHGLDYVEGIGSKVAMKGAWPGKIQGHNKGSDEALILPVSPRAAKSIIMLSQSLDEIVREKGGNPDPFESMMVAFKFVGAYSGILNEPEVRNNYDENHYSAMDAVIATTKSQFEAKKDAIAAAMGMLASGKKSEKILGSFSGRWKFMRGLVEGLGEKDEDS